MTSAMRMILVPSQARSVRQTDKPDKTGLWMVGIVAVIWAAGFVLGLRVSLSILTAVGFLAALAGLLKPGLGLLGVGILSTTDTFARVFLLGGGLFRFNSFNYLLALVVLISLPKMLQLVDIHTRLLQGLFAFMLLGIAISPDPTGGLFGLFSLSAEFGLLLYFVRAQESGFDLYWLALVNSVVSAMGCTVLLIQISSLRINPNAWSYMPLTALFSTCLAFRTLTAQRRVVLLLLSMANCGAIFLSGSRGSMAVACICVGYLLYESRSASMRLAFGLFGATLFMVATTVFPEMGAYAMHRINKTFDSRYGMAGRTSGRSELAEAGIEMAMENPFGHGTGSFAYELADTEGYAKQAHSGWIKTVVENGVFGLATLAAFMGSFAFVGWRQRSQVGAAALGTLVTIALSVALFSTEFNAKGLWFLAAGATVVLHDPRSARRTIRIQPHGMAPLGGS